MVYDQLSKDYRPHWAGNILDLCRRRFPRVREVDDVYFISCDHTHWPRARKAVDAVLALSLSETAPFPGAHLLFRLAENTAKVIDSACGGSAPYDHNAGWQVVEDLHAICEFLGDAAFTAEASSVAFNEQDAD
jgi:hypothetical protein